MRYHHTSQHLHGNLSGTHSRDCHLEQLQWGICSKKIDEICKKLPNVFGIADDILVAGYDIDGKDHDDAL